MRNNDLDARNFGNPTNTTSTGALIPNPQAQFIRNQFGGDGGGAIKKDKMFTYLSYEGLRQRQAVPSPTFHHFDHRFSSPQCNPPATVAASRLCSP